MKRSMIILVAVLLAVTLAVGGSVAMANLNGTDIEKTLSQSEASLGDHITVTLNVTDGVMGQTVVDTLPDPLKYINGTLNVTGGNATCVTSEGEIACTLAENATYTITFDVQVTSTEAGAFNVTNNATVAVANTSDSAELLITPYEGFIKEVIDCSELDPYNVTIATDVHWFVLLGVGNMPGDDIITMEGVVVKDRLGGDLELDDSNTTAWVDGNWTGGGAIMSKTTGKTEKEHLTWTGIPNFEDDDYALALLEISTDMNPGHGNGKNLKFPDGHQEYTEAGEHDLNSGAVLKFTDPDTGFQLSAHTPPITVVAVEPPG
jgi:hypothetical protein